MSRMKNMLMASLIMSSISGMQNNNPLIFEKKSPFADPKPKREKKPKKIKPKNKKGKSKKGKRHR